MSTYAGIYDNAMETRISEVSTIKLRTMAGSMFSDALVTSRGVNSMQKSNLDREFRVHKVFKFGATGHGIPDYDQTSLLGGTRSKAGPWAQFRPNAEAWPDHRNSPGLRTQSLEYGMFSYRASFPHFHDDVIAESDPTLVAKTLSDEVEAFGLNFALLFGHSFYVSGNTKFAYVSNITSSLRAIADADGSTNKVGTLTIPNFANDLDEKTSTRNVLAIDVSGLNQYALNKLEPGMAVDLVDQSDGDVLNEIFVDVGASRTASGVRAIGRVLACDWIAGMLYIAFFAEGAATGFTSSIVYAQNDLVDMRDLSDGAGGLTSVWPTNVRLVPAYSTRLSDNSVTKTMPLGVNDWWKTTGQLLAGSGYQNGTVGDGIINVGVLPQFKSYHEDLTGKSLTPELFDRIAHRLMPQYDRFEPGAAPDAAYTTYGVMQTYIENARSLAQVWRSDGSLDLSQEGRIRRLRFVTTSGQDFVMQADPFCDAGRLYMGKMGNNWEILTPPSTGGDTAGQPTTPSWLPFKFVAKTAGWSSNMVPVQTVANSTTRFTQDAYIPMGLKMQIGCGKIPVGAVLSNLTETTGYGASTNQNA